MPIVEPRKSNSAHFTPTYRKIEADLRRKIEMGDWKAGSMMPSRRDLASQYGVDVNTVQRAIKALLDDGILRAEGWRGTFIAGRETDHFDLSSVLPRTARAVVGVTYYAPAPQTIAQTWGEDWQATILRGIETTLAHAADTTLLTENRRVSGQNGLTPIKDVIARLLAEGAEALIIVFGSDGDIGDVLASVDTSRVPTIIISQGAERSGIIPTICYDIAHGGYLAAYHLIKQSYDRIVFFSPFRIDWSEERLEGVRDAMKHMRVAPEKLTVSDFDKEIDPIQITQSGVGYSYGAHLLTRPEVRGAGIVSVNDNVSHGLLRAAAELDMMAGRDFGLVSFDDSNRSRDLGISSLHPPLNAIGAEAAKWVQRGLNGEKIPLQICLQSHLVARKSSIPLQEDSISRGKSS